MFLGPAFKTGDYFQSLTVTMLTRHGKKASKGDTTPMPLRKRAKKDAAKFPALRPSPDP